MIRTKLACRASKALALVVAAVLMLSHVPLARAAGTTSPIFLSILGPAVNYGIVAEKFNLQAGDAQTNVAALVGTSKTQTGNDLTNNAEQSFILSQIEDTFRIKGNDAYVRTNANDASKLVGTGNTTLIVDTSKDAFELEAEIESMLSHVRTQSGALAAAEPTAEVVYDASSQKYVVDTRELGAGTHYVQVDEATFNTFANEASKLCIFKNDDQTIVFNVHEAVTGIQKFDLNGRGADSFLGSDAGVAPHTLVWNFVDATELAINGSITGVVIAPNASVNINATSSGWLVAREVNVLSGEWHNVFQGIEVLRRGSTASLAACKLVDGKDATASGFEFELAQRDDAWDTLQTVNNEGAKVTFSDVAFGETTHTVEDDTQTHVFRIAEKNGTTDEAGNAYVPDTTTYYAQVTVTRMTQVRPGGVVEFVYAASEPVYFVDEACTQPLDALPTFNNRTSDGSPDPDPTPDPDPEPTPDPEPDDDSNVTPGPDDNTNGSTPPILGGMGDSDDDGGTDETPGKGDANDSTITLTPQGGVVVQRPQAQQPSTQLPTTGDRTIMLPIISFVMLGVTALLVSRHLRRR